MKHNCAKRHLAKLITHSSDRQTSREQMRSIYTTGMSLVQMIEIRVLLNMKAEESAQSRRDVFDCGLYFDIWVTDYAKKAILQ